MTKTGWDMTDEDLRLELWKALHTAPTPSAIRALFPRPVAPTRKALRKFLFDRRGWFVPDEPMEDIIAALAYFALPAPTRTDVPSVEEIEKMLGRVLNFGSPHGLGVRVYDAARVAHAMMLELAPRQKMIIEGMTEEAIKKDMYSVWKKHPSDNWDGGAYVTIAAHRAYVLATTPAPVAPVVDPDAEAKQKLWDQITTLLPGNRSVLAGPEHAWKSLTEDQRNDWRRVVAKGD